MSGSIPVACRISTSIEISKLLLLNKIGEIAPKGPRGYSWFTHTQWEAQCKLQPCPCTNIYPGTFTHCLHLIDTWPSISAASRTGSSLRSIWSVHTVAWCTVPLLPPSEWPLPGECLCLLLVRACVHTVNLYGTQNAFVTLCRTAGHGAGRRALCNELARFYLCNSKVELVKSNILDVLGNMLIRFQVEGRSITGLSVKHEAAVSLLSRTWWEGTTCSFCGSFLKTEMSLFYDFYEI